MRSSATPAGRHVSARRLLPNRYRRSIAFEEDGRWEIERRPEVAGPRSSGAAYIRSEGDGAGYGALTFLTSATDLGFDCIASR